MRDRKAALMEALRVLREHEEVARLRRALPGICATPHSGTAFMSWICQPSPRCAC
ncbi:hypothetical protein [Streptomyces sennicomposti]